MAKKSMLEREKKRKKLTSQYFKKRQNILIELKTANSLEKIFELNEKLQKLPRNSSRTRIRNRCWKTGRPRGYFRFFGLCKNSLHKLTHNYLLPGIIKTS